MKCLKCGEENQDGAKFCSRCGEVLGTADYSPVIKEKPAKKKHPGRALLIILIVLIAAGAAAYAGYQYYLKKTCLSVTEEVFKCAHNMDFSPLTDQYGAEYFPEIIQENPDLRSYIGEQINSQLKAADSSGYLDSLGVQIDTDTVCDDIVDSASYEIVRAKTTWNSCTVTVRTSNIDYSQIPAAMEAKLQDTLSNVMNGDFSDLSGSASGLLDSLKNYVQKKIYSWFSEEESDDSDDLEEIREQLQEELLTWYEDAKNDASRLEETGEIVYQYQDGGWTVSHIDTSLFYTYYGITEDFIRGN